MKFSHSYGRKGRGLVVVHEEREKFLPNPSRRMASLVALKFLVGGVWGVCKPILVFSLKSKSWLKNCLCQSFHGCS